MATQTAKLTVVEGAQIIAELAPVAIDLALKLQTLFSNMSVQTVVTDITGDALSVDKNTIDVVNSWAASHNLAIE